MADFRSMKLFKDVLSEALEKNGMSAIALAEKAEVNRSRISQFTSGHSLPKDETIVAICGAFPAVFAATLAKAWVRERLGSSLGDAILTSGIDSAAGTEIEKLYSSLPTAAANAFRLLMELSREDADLRQSIISLAAFAEPEVPFQVTQIIGPDTPGSQSPTAQEISEPPPATAAASPTSTDSTPALKPIVKRAKWRAHIIDEQERKVAEPSAEYKTKKPKTGTVY